MMKTPEGLEVIQNGIKQVGSYLKENFTPTDVSYVSRRRFLEAWLRLAEGAVALEIFSNLPNLSFEPTEALAASVRTKLNIARAVAQEARYTIVPIDYEPGRGAQSHLWLPARVDISSYFDTLDQADQAILGDYSYFAQHGSSGKLYQAGATARMNAVRNGPSWVGDCLPASLAAGNLPIIEGDIESPAPGLPGMSWIERMVLGVIYHRFPLKQLVWIPGMNYQDLQDLHNRLIDEDRREYLIADTSDNRGNSGEEWYDYVDGFEGDIVRMTDFLGWDELGQAPKKKTYRARASNLTGVYLVDSSRPSNPDPNSREYNNYRFTINKPATEVYLGMAIVQ